MKDLSARVEVLEKLMARLAQELGVKPEPPKAECTCKVYGPCPIHSLKADRECRENECECRFYENRCCDICQRVKPSHTKESCEHKHYAIKSGDKFFTCSDCGHTWSTKESKTLAEIFMGMGFHNSESEEIVQIAQEYYEQIFDQVVKEPRADFTANLRRKLFSEGK